MVKLKKSGEKNLDSQSPVVSIGGRLRAARENKGLSLEDVYRVTKIHPATIEALENGGLEERLGWTYALAFIRDYSVFLGLDAGSIIAEYGFKKHAGGSRQEEPKIDERPGSGKEIFGRLAVFIVIFAALTFGVVTISQYTRNAFLKIKERKAVVKISEQLRLKETPVYNQKTQPVKEENIMPIPKAKALTLVLNTSNDVWLKVIVDGKAAFHKILSKNSKETWRGEKEIRLSEIGKPEALKMTVNGKDIDCSKHPTRSILITHEGVDFEPK